MLALLAAAHGDNSSWLLSVSAAHGTDDTRRDTFASHETANTLPAYNVRRFTHEHPPCLELTRLPWANRAPAREAPLQCETATTGVDDDDWTRNWKPPEPQTDIDSITPTVIRAVSELKEWDEVKKAITDARADFDHKGKAGHRRRRTERVIPVEVLRPLIGNVVLDTRRAQSEDGTIDWSKVVALDTTHVTPNAMNHAGIAKIGKDYSDKEILYEMKNGVVDTSDCDNILRVSPHHNGAMEQHEQVSAMLKKEAGLGYYDGPYKSVPFVGCRVLPLNVVVQMRPDGTLKYRICRDGGWDHDGDSPNDCIDMSQQPQLILVRIQDFALAGAILRSAGLKVYFWVIDLVGAYRQLTKATRDVHKQVMLWFDPETGDPQFWVDMRCYFGDRIMVHKFSRVSNFIVYCVTEKVWARDDHTNPAEPELKAWIARRKQSMSEPEQSSLMYAAMYIDDLGGISIGEERANRDYDDAMDTIEKDVGMEAQRAHGKEQRPSDQRIDLLGATFHIPSETLDVTERFKAKLIGRLLEVKQRGTWDLTICEQVTYSANHAAQLSISDGRAHLNSFFVDMRKLRRKVGRLLTVSTRAMEDISWWLLNVPIVREVPWAPALFFPQKGDGRRIDPEMDASGKVGFGAACPLPGGLVVYFYGHWNATELALHINIKEALTSWWAMVIFGELTPTFCASLRTSRTYSNERIDNTVAISAAAKNSAKEWMMQQIVAKRAEAQRVTGWTYSQQYIASKLNDLADPLSRGRLDIFMENARRRGLTTFIPVEVDDVLRDTSFLFKVTH